MPHLISASRRTDIPAFYTDWLINRLDAGFAVIRQPYSGRPARISLRREDLGGIVFWSKNYGPLLPKLDRIEQRTKNLFFHFTITANKELETRVPDHRETIKDYLFLATRYSPGRVVWRFDPLCITDRCSFERHEERFVRCAELLRGRAEQCIISFVHPYKKVLTSLKKYSNQALLGLSEEQKRGYALRLASRADTYGIRVFSCCNDYLLSDKVRKAPCIDGRRLSELFESALDLRPASTRTECACAKSVDIGAYDTCAHGCLYCYANADKDRAALSYEQHDAAWNCLTGHIDEREEEQKQQALFK